MNKIKFMKYVKRFIMREIFAIIYYEMLVGVENLAFYLQNKKIVVFIIPTNDVTSSLLPYM